MKKCIKCKTNKLETDFPITSRKGSRKNICKICFNLYRRNLYRDNPQYKKTYKKYRIKHGNITAKKNRQEILKYFKTHPCKDCGEVNPIVLEFDHIKSKSFGISSKVKNYPWHKILPEIKKCEVRCSNCHAIKTAVEQNAYLDILHITDEQKYVGRDGRRI